MTMTNANANAHANTKSKADFIYGTAGAFLTVRIRGEIDHHSASAIRTGIDELLLEKRPERTYLDLSAVSFMDSSGLGLIMGRYAVMKELGGELVVLDPTPETQTILALAGMERLLRIEVSPGREETAQAASPGSPDGPARRKPEGKRTASAGRRRTDPPPARGHRPDKPHSGAGCGAGKEKKPSA